MSIIMLRALKLGRYEYPQKDRYLAHQQVTREAAHARRASNKRPRYSPESMLPAKAGVCHAKRSVLATNGLLMLSGKGLYLYETSISFL